MKAEASKGIIIGAAVIALILVVWLGWTFMSKTPGATPPAPPGTKMKAPPPPPPPMNR